MEARGNGELRGVRRPIRANQSESTSSMEVKSILKQCARRVSYLESLAVPPRALIRALPATGAGVDSPSHCQQACKGSQFGSGWLEMHPAIVHLCQDVVYLYGKA